MYTPEKFKKYIEDKINEVQFQLISTDGFMPILLVADGEGVDEIEIQEKASMEQLGNLLKEKSNGAISCCLIMNAHIATRTESQIKSQPQPEDISKEPDARESILTILYSKNETEVKKILYIKNNGYQFFNLDWIKDECVKGNLTNPFTSN